MSAASKQTPAGQSLADRVLDYGDAHRQGSVEGFAWCIVCASMSDSDTATAMAIESTRRYGKERTATELRRRHFDPAKVGIEV